MAKKNKTFIQFLDRIEFFHLNQMGDARESDRDMGKKIAPTVAIISNPDTSERTMNHNRNIQK